MKKIAFKVYFWGTTLLVTGLLLSACAPDKPYVIPALSEPVHFIQLRPTKLKPTHFVVCNKNASKRARLACHPLLHLSIHPSIHPAIHTATPPDIHNIRGK